MLLSQLTAYGHEMRPAIADIIVSPAQVSVTIRFNAELFLADIDASTIKDSDDAPNAAAYDRIRQLSPVALVMNLRNGGPPLQTISMVKQAT